MGILQTKLNEFKEGKADPVVAHSSSSRRKGASTDSYLLDELDRFEKYIDDDELKKIIDLQSGLKHGVDKIGSKGDTAGVLGFGEGQIFQGTTQRAKQVAARHYVMQWAKRNLTETIATKTKEVTGKMISRNIYIKEVSYQRAGKTISYLQARNLKSGRMVSLKTAHKLMGKN